MTENSEKRANKLSWGSARVEINAFKTEILDALNKGYPASTIYRQFLEEGRFSMKKSSFYKHLAKFKAMPKVSDEKPEDKPDNSKMIFNTSFNTFKHDPVASKEQILKTWNGES